MLMLKLSQPSFFRPTLSAGLACLIVVTSAAISFGLPSRVSAQSRRPQRQPAQRRPAATQRPAARTQSTDKKRVAKVSSDAVRAAKALAPAKGITAGLYAAEPLVANPVALDIDERGRVFVCETYRQDNGVEDNRNHEEWLEDDLASKTTDDRLAMLKKYLKGDISKFSKKQDRIRLLTDRNRDGRADRSTVFIDGFKDPLDGTGASVLARKGNVFYTCIPKLYAFRDDNNDGKADRKTTMFDGFGVRTAYRGHDLHGLVMGPDGRLYFSMGDRGFNVKTKTGVVKNVETGAILRCELDGRNLEIVAIGLRNPQDLAFDEYGNLFTCDNNSDSGDRARWLHIHFGGDYGWRMAYQYFSDRGPFNREHMWEVDNSRRPRGVIPPIANIADGPAGLTYYPGTGLNQNYNGNFFLCDFRGEAGQSGIRTFKLRPKGGSYELIDEELFLWNCLATDCEFGPDGAMYVSDWVEGWKGSGKGRIYRLTDPKEQRSKIVAETAKLLADGMRKRNVKDLATLMTHLDRRIRMEAQFELARRGEVAALATVATKSRFTFAKLHGVWGLGQIARATGAKEREAALEELVALLQQADEETRAAAATALGDARHERAAKMIAKRLYDKSARIRVASGLALSKIGNEEVAETLLEMLTENAGSDPAVLHAGVMGLAKSANDTQLKAVATNPDPSARMAAVLALRRRQSPILAKFLNDKDERIVIEAVRAIHDEPIPFLFPQVAELLTGENQDDALVRRALNAHFHLGKPANVQALAKYAADPTFEMEMRQFALAMVGDWDTKSARDQVLGVWRPVMNKHNGHDAVVALKSNLGALMKSGQEIRTRTAELAAQFGLPEVNEELVNLLWEKQRSGKERAGALLALMVLDPDNLESECDKALEDDEPRVRAASRIVLTSINPTKAVPHLIAALKSGSELERQSAVAMLSSLDREDADKMLASLVKLRREDRIPSFLKLDVIMAAQKRADVYEPIATELEKFFKTLDPKDTLAPYRDTMVGGNAERGERLFNQRAALGCVKCHRVDGKGGAVGPDLAGIGSKLSREEILESIADPNKTIAKGYETAVITKDDGRIVSGIIKSMDDDKVMLMTADEKLVSIDRDEIEEVTRGKSSMPAEIITYLTTFDLRDLMEYLATLK